MFGVRLEPDLESKLAALAKRQGKSKSDVARDAIRRYLTEDDLVVQARRQSLLVSQGDDDRDAPDLIDETADTEGWQ